MSLSQQTNPINMKIEVTTDIAIEHLRSDIVEALGYDGVDAIINYYDAQDADMAFDPSLFADFDKYEDLESAMTKIYPDAHREIIESYNGDIFWHEAHERFLEYFRDRGRIAILLDDEDIFGEVLISQR